MSRHREADLSAVNTHSIEDRPSKVHLSDVASTFEPDQSFRTFLDALPGQFAGPDLRELARRIASSHRAGLPVIAMFGGHVIKCGLGPLLIDLVHRGIVTHLATNGSGAIHDLELAWFGKTSEDVATRLDDGTFGFARETAEIFGRAARRAGDESIGLGEALAMDVSGGAPHAASSVLACADEKGIPLTVHVSLGAEIVHQHPELDGAALGESSLRDFRILASSVGDLVGGGVVLNIGSSVILPEVFLKSLTVARNLGADAHGFATADLDMIRHYRPMENVVRRPVRTGGWGVHLTGHHEIMIPLLYGAIRAEVEAR